MQYNKALPMKFKMQIWPLLSLKLDAWHQCQEDQIIRPLLQEEETA